MHIYKAIFNHSDPQIHYAVKNPVLHCDVVVRSSKSGTTPICTSHLIRSTVKNPVRGDPLHTINHFNL